MVSIWQSNGQKSSVLGVFGSQCIIAPGLTDLSCVHPKFEIFMKTVSDWLNRWYAKVFFST